MQLTSLEACRLLYLAEAGLRESTSSFEQMIRECLDPSNSMMTQGLIPVMRKSLQEQAAAVTRLHYIVIKSGYTSPYSIPPKPSEVDRHIEKVEAELASQTVEAKFRILSREQAK